jgi:hypothetical protein
MGAHRGALEEILERSEGSNDRSSLRLERLCGCGQPGANLCSGQYGEASALGGLPAPRSGP